MPWRSGLVTARQSGPLPECVLTAAADAMVDQARPEWGSPPYVFSPEPARRTSKPSATNTIKRIVPRAAGYCVRYSSYGALKDRWEPGMRERPDRSACGRNGAIWSGDRGW